MLIKDLCGDFTPQVSYLQDSPLWCRDVDDITSLDLLLFFLTAADEDHAAAVELQIHALQNRALGAIVTGEVGQVDWICWSPPSLRLTLGEITQMFSVAPFERRRALMFALETGLDLKRVVALNWKQLKSIKLTPFAQQVIDSQTRHIRLPYVFWEWADANTAMPLLSLDVTALEVSEGHGWAWFTDRCRDAVLIDTGADAEHFKAVFSRN